MIFGMKELFILAAFTRPGRLKVLRVRNGGAVQLRNVRAEYITYMGLQWLMELENSLAMLVMLTSLYSYMLSMLM